MIEKLIGYEINNFDIDPVYEYDKFIGININVQPKILFGSITNNITIKKPCKNMNKILDLKEDDKIFCIKFVNQSIDSYEYVNIDFYDNEDDRKYFTTIGKNIDLDTFAYNDDLNNHCFLISYMSDFNSIHYFFTLNPKNWKHDILIEMEKENCRVIEKFNKKLDIYRNEIKECSKDTTLDGMFKK